MCPKHLTFRVLNTRCQRWAPRSRAQINHCSHCLIIEWKRACFYKAVWGESISFYHCVQFPLQCFPQSENLDGIVRSTATTKFLTPKFLTFKQSVVGRSTYPHQVWLNTPTHTHTHTHTNKWHFFFYLFVREDLFFFVIWVHLQAACRVCLETAVVK